MIIITIVIMTKCGHGLHTNCRPGLNRNGRLQCLGCNAFLAPGDVFEVCSPRFGSIVIIISIISSSSSIIIIIITTTTAASLA
jgi:hypothetical protein